MKCDIKIMASPKRYAYVLNLCKILNLDIDKDVFFDDRPNGGDAAYTSERTWGLQFEDGVTHRCVLQDDVMVCRNFNRILDRITSSKPNAIFSLFCSQSKMEDYAKKYGVPQLVSNKRYGVWGPAVVAPKSAAMDFYDWGRKIAVEYDARIAYDDVLFGEYAADHGMEVYIPVPNLVQHLCPTRSLLGFNNKNKTSKVFDVDADGLVWESAVESKISIPNSTKFYK